jgi:hypothetical protein
MLYILSAALRGLWVEMTREKALLSSVDSMVSEVTLEDIPRVARAILDGQIRGGVLVTLH